MQVKAKLSHLRIAPRKVRLVAALLRKKKVDEAKEVLSFTIKKASEPLLKLLNSAVSNAKNNFQLDPDNLYISKVIVDEGIKYKRWMPRARGLAAEIKKRTSSITLILDEINPVRNHARPAKSGASEGRKGRAISNGVKPGKKIKKSWEKKKVEKEAKKEPEPKTISVENEKNKKENLEFKKPKPQAEKPALKPRIMRGINRIFRRKSF